MQMQQSSLLGNNSLTSFVIKLLFFFAAIFIIDRGVGAVMKHYYFKQITGQEYKTKYAMDDCKEEVLVFGSSRAEWIVHPGILQEKLGMSCYNVGRNGHLIYYHYALLKSVLNRYKPKMIILDIDALMFGRNADEVAKISTLLPFYDSHSEIHAIIESRGPYEKIKLLSKMYPYNSLLLPILSGNSSFNKMKNANINGYSPLTNVFNEPLKKVDYTKSTLTDSGAINVFKAFVEDCLNANVKLVMICPPYIIESTGRDTSIKIAMQFAAEKGIPFFDNSIDSFYISKPYLFADYRHLNDKGVEIYTKDLAVKIAALK